MSVFQKLQAFIQASALPLIFCTVALLCLSPTHSSEAGPPSDTLRAIFGEANKILTDPATEQRPLERLVTIQALIGTVFDFRDAAEHSLGSKWQASSTAEQAEFTRIFTEFMQRGFVYLLASVADVDGHGGGIAVRFLRESLDQGRATVQVAIAGRGGRLISLSHELVYRDRRWVVRDVSIEGVSLVANYRAQFDRVIRVSSYPDLIQRMKTRVATESLPQESVESGAAADVGR
jgi:phospholipid transport system substrate-binding protein